MTPVAFGIRRGCRTFKCLYPRDFVHLTLRQGLGLATGLCSMFQQR